MNFLKRNANVILLCLFEVLIGVLLLVDPIGFTSAIIITVGAALSVAGMIFVISYFRTDAVEAALKGTLVKGLAMLLAGVFCILQPTWFITAFPLLTILYGAAILLAGLSKVQWAVDAIRLKTGRWLLPAISAAVSIVCACVILSDPFESTIILWMFTGISLIVAAVLDVVVMFFTRLSEATYTTENKE